LQIEKKNHNEIIMEGLPDQEDFQDFNGKQVKFRYVFHDGGNVYSCRAYEESKAEVSRVFCVYDQLNPANCLYKIREIIMRELNTRYFSETEYDAFHQMNFDYFKGNIASDKEGELCIVVDGKKMNMNDLENLLSTHEGFELKITISDGST
jgi:hypothetical protein